MRKILIAGVAATAFCGAPALAADMAVKAPPPPPAPVYSWTGFYIGANAGGAWSKADVTSTFAPGANANIVALDAADSPSLTGSGFTGGGQAGFNYQAGAVVWGVEADINALRTSGSQVNNANFPIGGVAFTTTNSFSTSWLATVRPRIGVAFDRTLLYATGGLAVTHLNYSTLFTSAAGNFETANLSTTRTGWTVGGGLEYAWSANWSAKIEYLYMNFGNASISAPDFFLGVQDGTITNSVHLTSNLVRAGLNYRFGGPIVAKY
ncbi:MAG: outer membrane protein [Thermoguttaceae bacterium]|jgi:outer membrane immunogenic protein